VPQNYKHFFYCNHLGQFGFSIAHRLWLALSLVGWPYTKASLRRSIALPCICSFAIHLPLLQTGISFLLKQLIGAKHCNIYKLKTLFLPYDCRLYAY
jgi:hypothetical protein